MAYCILYTVPLSQYVCMCPAGYFHDCEPDIFERQMQLNYMGSVHAAMAVYSGMVARNSGQICFIASTMALMGEQQCTAAERPAGACLVLLWRCLCRLSWRGRVGSAQHLIGSGAHAQPGCVLLSAGCCVGE